MRTLPEASVARLPVYLRVLSELALAGRTVVSSDALAALAGVGPAQVRRDLAPLGPRGTRGVGYDVVALRDRLQDVLGLTHEWPVVIVGAGNLGQALAGYAGFADRGFRVAALVDVDPLLVGSSVAGLVVDPAERLEDAVLRSGASIAVVATPPGSAQAVCDRLVAAGVRSILNFAPVLLVVPAHVEVRDVDLSVELALLAFHEQRRAADLPLDLPVREGRA
ncbi:redox-sensing transcriptional repressor Rex [Motilibacter rhizosphaerae]|uniref:redox-sensing transcriptional repressor Rex n=1 Tax=Motilibacter rhizosphaerae TaxID=598652 RepID=UPI0038B3E167